MRALLTDYDWRILREDIGAEMPHTECAYLRGEIESVEFDPMRDGQKHSITLERTWLDFAKDFGMHL